MPAFSGKGVEYSQRAGEVKSAARVGLGECAGFGGGRLVRSRARPLRPVADAAVGDGAAWHRTARRVCRTLRGGATGGKPALAPSPPGHTGGDPGGAAAVGGGVGSFGARFGPGAPGRPSGRPGASYP